MVVNGNQKPETQIKPKVKMTKTQTDPIRQTRLPAVALVLFESPFKLRH